jgi:alpha-tubulin suppressor-like RCC1 family protein
VWLAPAGKHDGAVEEQRYFQTAPNHGLFIRASEIELDAEDERNASMVLADPAGSDHTSAEPPFSETGDEVSDLVSSSSVAGPRSHRRNQSSTEIARDELEQLLAQSNFRDEKNAIMKSLSSRIARRPSTSELLKSGILDRGRGSTVPTAQFALPILEPSPAPAAADAAAALPALAEEAAASAPPAAIAGTTATAETKGRRMYVWGQNSHGELSTGDEADCLLPTELRLPPPKRTKTTGATGGVPAPVETSSQYAGPTDFAQVSGSRHTTTISNQASTPPDPRFERNGPVDRNCYSRMSWGVANPTCFPVLHCGCARLHVLLQVALGLNHIACLTLHNELLTCGSWIAGLLGSDDRMNLHRLKRVKAFEELRRTAAGRNNPIISIAAGDRHTVALHRDGTAESFGGTLYGKLGHHKGASDGGAAEAAMSENQYFSIQGLRGQKVSTLSCGNCHTVACTVDGSLFSFGGGGKFYNYGQLGHGDFEDQLVPKQIELFGHGLPSSRVQVKSIVCGGYHTLALTVDRLVYAWGSGKYGQLGLGHDNNESVPQLVTALVPRSNIGIGGPNRAYIPSGSASHGRTTGLAAGEHHSLCVQSDGSVYSWGYNMQCQLGHSGVTENIKIPRKILFFAKRNVIVVQVDAGWQHSIALTESYQVYTWGNNDHGQLGQGDTKSSREPQLVQALDGIKIQTVAAGGRHSLAFTGFFTAAQELVFLQRVRELKQARERQASITSPGGSRIPTLGGIQLDGTVIPPSPRSRSPSTTGASGITSPPPPRPSSVGLSASSPSPFSPTPMIPGPDVGATLAGVTAQQGPQFATPSALVPLHLKTFFHSVAGDSVPLSAALNAASASPQTPAGAAASSAAAAHGHHHSLSSYGGANEEGLLDFSPRGGRFRNSTSGGFMSPTGFTESSLPGSVQSTPRVAVALPDLSGGKGAATSFVSPVPASAGVAALGQYSTSGSGGLRCIEIVYSLSLRMLHRFITFRTSSTRQQIDELITEYAQQSKKLAEKQQRNDLALFQQ